MMTNNMKRFAASVGFQNKTKSSCFYFLLLFFHFSRRNTQLIHDRNNRSSGNWLFQPTKVVRKRCDGRRSLMRAGGLRDSHETCELRLNSAEKAKQACSGSWNPATNQLLFFVGTENAPVHLQFLHWCARTSILGRRPCCHGHYDETTKQQPELHGHHDETTARITWSITIIRKIMTK